MSMNNKVPEIRFKGFSGEWESFPLEGISDVLDGDRGCNYPNGEELKEQGHTLFLSASNVTKNGFRFDTRQYITQDKSESLGSGKLIIDDIVLTSRGSIGHIAWYNENIIKEIPFARINSGMLILRVKNNIDPSVISQYLNSPEGKKKIEIISFGSAQPQLTKASVLKFPVTIPSEKLEQTQIGNYFQKLDALINQHQQKHNKLSSIKKAMLEKMFPKPGETMPEIRFKGFSGEWKEVTLSSVIDVRSGKDYKHLGKGYIPVYGTGGYMHSVDSALSNDKDAIGIGRKGTIDKPYILRAPFWTVDTLFYAVPFTNFNLDFLFCLFQKIDWKKHDESTGVPSLSKIAINNLPVYTTNELEQTAIGNYFQKLDTLINQHQQQITKLNNIKQACLSKMFV